MLRFGLDALVRKHHRIGMAKENGNAGSKAAAKAKRASANAKKTRAAKDAAAVKASLVGRRVTPAVFLGQSELVVGRAAEPRLEFLLASQQRLAFSHD